MGVLKVIVLMRRVEGNRRRFGSHERSTVVRSSLFSHFLKQKASRVFVPLYMLWALQWRCLLDEPVETHLAAVLIRTHTPLMIAFTAWTPSCENDGREACPLHPPTGAHGHTSVAFLAALHLFVALLLEKPRHLLCLLFPAHHCVTLKRANTRAARECRVRRPPGCTAASKNYLRTGGEVLACSSPHAGLHGGAQDSNVAGVRLEGGGWGADRLISSWVTLCA